MPMPDDLLDLSVDKSFSTNGRNDRMPTPDDLLDLYGKLRAQILTRHFALGRYFRADYLSLFNHLGYLHQQGSTIGDCNDAELPTCGVGPTQPSTYSVLPLSVGDNSSTADLLSKPEAFQVAERWRVANHERENPLMLSGQLMICLATEHYLGVPGSKALLMTALASIGSLYRSSKDHFQGCPIRWDPLTSDKWVIIKDGSQLKLDHCCEFLFSSEAGGYLYSTPLADPRYTAYISDDRFRKLTHAQKNDYYSARRRSLKLYRAWEVSMDELVGLIMGYDYVFRVVPDQDVRDEVKRQVQQLADYLAEHAYLLVRPAGGFSARGASGVLPAFEFPFGQVFERITGDHYRSRSSFEGALQKAGVWPCFAGPLAWATVAGIGATVLAAALSVLLGGYVLAAAVISVVGLTLGLIAARALAIMSCVDCLDVESYPGDGPEEKQEFQSNHGEQQEFPGAYLLRQLPLKFRFTSYCLAERYVNYGSPTGFLPFLGLTGLDDPDHIVRDAYLGWLPERRKRSDKVKDAVQHAPPPRTDPFASAVAVVLGAGPAEEKMLVDLLNTLYGPLHQQQLNSTSSKVLDQLLVEGGQGTDPYTEQISGGPHVWESVPPALDFMAAVALAWLHAKRRADAGSPVPASTGFPTMPTGSVNWPTLTIPDVVVNNADAEGIPVDALPPLGEGLPSDVPLFGGSAPTKPADPPSPPPVTPIYSAVMSHSGGFGGKGDDAINQNQTVVGAGCKILGVTLELVDKHGSPYDDPETKISVQRRDPGPSLRDAHIGQWPSAGARIESVATNDTDETVNVHWWYDTGRACRYRICYLVEGQSCSL